MMYGTGQHATTALSRGDRYRILAAAFLGWLGAGMQMAVMNLCTPAVITHFYQTAQASTAANVAIAGGSSFATTPLTALIPQWFAWFNAAFLLGAALGGLLFGWLGDRHGRVRALWTSILCYSLGSFLGYAAQSPEQLLLLRFVAALGVGGIWPAGVALCSEAWSAVSRPTLAGLIGAAANVGIMLMGLIGMNWKITAGDWRWMMLVAASPVVLGIWVAGRVRESPEWLAQRNSIQALPPASTSGSARRRVGLWLVFGPQLWRRTLLGIALGTIPLLGGWGITSWVIPWADAVRGSGDPAAKALASVMRSAGGAAGSLLGGWLANLLGRRTTYFLISLGSLATAQLLFGRLSPLAPSFSAWVFALGFISTIFFGWLPLYLPELFPTEARATGSGVAFNFGRIATAAGVLATGTLMSPRYFNGDYAAVGQWTSLIYALGMVIICFAPDTTVPGPTAAALTPDTDSDATAAAAAGASRGQSTWPGR